MLPVHSCGHSSAEQFFHLIIFWTCFVDVHTPHRTQSVDDAAALQTIIATHSKIKCVDNKSNFIWCTMTLTHNSMNVRMEANDAETTDERQTKIVQFSVNTYERRIRNNKSIDFYFVVHRMNFECVSIHCGNVRLTHTLSLSACSAIIHDSAFHWNCVVLFHSNSIRVTLLSGCVQHTFTIRRHQHLLICSAACVLPFAYFFSLLLFLCFVCLIFSFAFILGRLLACTGRGQSSQQHFNTRSQRHTESVSTLDEWIRLANSIFQNVSPSIHTWFATYPTLMKCWPNAVERTKCDYCYCARSHQLCSTRAKTMSAPTHLNCLKQLPRQRRIIFIYLTNEKFIKTNASHLGRPNDRKPVASVVVFDAICAYRMQSACNVSFHRNHRTNGRSSPAKVLSFVIVGYARCDTLYLLWSDCHLALHEYRHELFDSINCN